MKRKSLRLLIAAILLIISVVLLYLSYRPSPINNQRIPMPTIEAPWVDNPS